MAITATQSTGDILAQRQAQKQALLDSAPQQAPKAGVLLDASNPIGLISQGLSGAANALTAGNRRRVAQENLERAAAITREQQQYSRGRDAKADERQARLDELQALRDERQGRNVASQIKSREAQSSLLQQQELDRITDRNALIRKERAQAAANEAAVGFAEERAKAYSDAKIDPNSAGFQMAQEINLFDKQRAEGGDKFDAVQEYINAQPEDIKSDVGAIQNIKDDVNDGLTQAKEAAGKKWDKSYEQLAVQRALRGAELSGGFLGFNKGNFDEEGFRERLKTEMANILDARATALTVQGIEGAYDKKVAAEKLKVEQAALR